MDLDHLVSYCLHPNRVAILFRVLARNLQFGYQLDRWPDLATRREWRWMRSPVVERPGLVWIQGMTIEIIVDPKHPLEPYHIYWAGQLVRLAAPP